MQPTNAGDARRRPRPPLRVRRPSSGSSPSSVRLTIGPTPGTLCRRSSWARQTGLCSMSRPRSRSTSASSRWSQRMCVRMRRATGARAKPRRWRSAVSISSSCRRRVSTASSAWAASSGSGRGAGRTRSAKSAKVWASITSVLASCPVARAKSRTWRGLATTTGTPAAASAATTACSKPPVASRTTSVGPRDWSRVTQREERRFLVRELPALATGPHGDVQASFGHIDADEDR